MKNPWCCVRWRGDYSPYDKKNWTKMLENELGYNRKESVKLRVACLLIYRCVKYTLFRQ
jgi:hypothetical protein